MPCKRKLNYVIMGPSGFVHDIQSIRSRCRISEGVVSDCISSAAPELTWVCTESMNIKAQLKLIKKKDV